MPDCFLKGLLTVCISISNICSPPDPHESFHFCLPAGCFNLAFPASYWDWASVVYVCAVWSCYSVNCLFLPSAIFLFRCLSFCCQPVRTVCATQAWPVCSSSMVANTNHPFTLLRVSSHNFLPPILTDLSKRFLVASGLLFLVSNFSQSLDYKYSFLSFLLRLLLSL